MALKTRYSPLQHFSLDNVYNSFVELPPKNRLVALGIVGLILVLLLFLPLSLASGRIGKLRREIGTAKKGYRDVMVKVQEYEKAKAGLAEIEAMLGGNVGSLTSKVEGMAKDSGLQVSQLKEKPSQETDYLEISSAELRLAGVGLGQLVDFLTAVEQDRSGVLRLRRIQVKPKFSNRQLLDVNCEIATFTVRKEI